MLSLALILYMRQLLICQSWDNAMKRVHYKSEDAVARGKEIY